MGINLIWAEATNGVIGQNGQMPWHSHEDMVHFRHLTSGHSIIMGWKTFCSLGQKPLPKRQNIILTHRQLTIDGVQTASLPEIKDLVSDQTTDYFVIGGASVYQQLLPLATRLYRTVIQAAYPGDKKMPPIDYDQWQLVDSQAVTAKKSGEPDCLFEVWQPLDEE